MNWFFVLSSFILVILIWSVGSIISNYNVARKVGLPLVISPVAPLNPLWILLYRTIPSVLLLKYLPFGLGRWARCTVMGWTFQDKHAMHDELGPIFTVVTPAGIELSVADPHVTHTIFSHRKEFIKPAVMYGKSSGIWSLKACTDKHVEQLNVFGRNLNTVRILPRHCGI